MLIYLSKNLYYSDRLSSLYLMYPFFIFYPTIFFMNFFAFYAVPWSFSCFVGLFPSLPQVAKVFAPFLLMFQNLFETSPLLLNTKETFSSQEGIRSILRGEAFSMSMLDSEIKSSERSPEKSPKSPPLEIVVVVITFLIFSFFFLNDVFFLNEIFFLRGFLFFLTDVDLDLLLLFLAFLAFFFTGAFFLEAFGFLTLGSCASTIPRHKPTISLIRLELNFPILFDLWVKPYTPRTPW